jgi:hypothetical protein
VWMGCENAQIVFYNGSTLVSSGSDAIFTITSVDVDNRKLTLSGTATGIGDLDTALAAGDRQIYWYGSVTGSLSFSNFAGVDKIVTNTGTLFGISAATYNLWKGSSYSASSGALTLSKVSSAVAQAVNRGLAEDVTCFVNPRTWANLMSDQAALRRHGAETGKAEDGFEALRFHGQNGAIDITSTSMVKEGEAFILPLKRLKRIGAQDMSFKTPGRGDEIFLHIPDKAGYELRVWAHQALFCETPAKCVKITSIVNS